jgi:hypothetical protein
MLTALVLFSALGAAQPSILVVPATAASRPVCEELLESFTSHDVRVKLAGEKAEAVTCTSKQKPADRTACLVDSLTLAKVDAIVLVTAVFTKAGKGSVVFQLLSRNGESERQEVVRGLRKKVVALSKPAIGRTLGTLQSMLLIEEMHAMDTPKVEPAEQPPPTPPQQQPFEVKLQPRENVPAVPPAVAAIAPPPAKNRTGAIVLTSVAVATAGVGVAFTALGFDGKGRLSGVAGGVSPLSYSQANALKDQSNLQLTVGLSAGITAAVAATIAGVLWAQ